MMLAFSGTLLPAWVVLPPAALTLIVIAIHIVGLQRPDLPGGPRRRRVRTSAGLLMMIVTAMLAYALCIDPFADHPATQPREAGNSLLLWLAIVGLVGMIVVLAAMDALHTLSLMYLASRKVRRAMVAKTALEAAEMAKARRRAEGSGEAARG